MILALDLGLISYGARLRQGFSWVSILRAFLVLGFLRRLIVLGDCDCGGSCLVLEIWDLGRID